MLLNEHLEKEIIKNNIINNSRLLQWYNQEYYIDFD